MTRLLVSWTSFQYVYRKKDDSKAPRAWFQQPCHSCLACHVLLPTASRAPTVGRKLHVVAGGRYSTSSTHPLMQWETPRITYGPAQQSDGSQTPRTIWTIHADYCTLQISNVAFYLVQRQRELPEGVPHGRQRIKTKAEIPISSFYLHLTTRASGEQQQPAHPHLQPKKHGKSLHGWACALAGCQLYVQHLRGSFVATVLGRGFPLRWLRARCR